MSIWWFCLADNSVIPEEFVVIWTLVMYILCSFAVKQEAKQKNKNKNKTKNNKKQNKKQKTNKQTKRKRKGQKEKNTNKNLQWYQIWVKSLRSKARESRHCIFYFFKWKFQTGYFGQNFDYFYQISLLVKYNNDSCLNMGFTEHTIWGLGLGLWCLLPLLTIFHLYRGCQFYWWS